MTLISDELLYTLNLPWPPSFTLTQDPNITYKVPDFVGFESASTRWIIAMLTNKTSLRRLIKFGNNFETIFSRWYQIPDRPIALMGSDYPLETPAYHQQSILYLTPIALALYMKQTCAVEMLLDLKNESGRKVVHPAEACFVQRVFKKGAKRITNELSNTYPIIIAIRRGFYEGIALLVENGFTPQKQFSVIHRKVFRETVSLYRDVLDYIVSLLRNRPGTNASKIVKILLDPSVGLTTFDVFSYDIELDDFNNWDYVSVFRRITRIGFGTRYYIEESSTQVLNILEQIQMAGYFCGIDQLQIYYNGALPPAFDRVLSTEVLTELQSDKMSMVMEKIPTIIKATRDDLFKLDQKELKERMNYDYQCSIGILLLWYQRCLFQERCTHYAKLAFLLSKIMMDSKIVEEFFSKTDVELAAVFTEWAQDLIKPATVINFRIRLQDYILFYDPLCVQFINTYGQSPFMLINATMLHGKRPESSPVVHDLIVMASSHQTEDLTEKLETNQSNELVNPSVLNVIDKETKLAIKFIPANHPRTFTLNNHFSTNFNRHSRHLSLSRTEHRTVSSLNNANSLESLKSLDIKGCNSNLPYPPETCEMVINIKSPTESLYESSVSNRTPNLDDIIPPTDVLFRPRMPKGYKKVSLKCSRKSSKKVRHNTILVSNSPEISSDEMKERLKILLATNEKYRDFKLIERKDKVPLKSLREEIKKYKSVDNIVKLIRSKGATQLDCLYNNLDADAIIQMIRRLSVHTIISNEKSTNNDFSHVFQSKI